MKKKPTRKLQPPEESNLRKRSKIAALAPNHPFAHNCIIFGGPHQTWVPDEHSQLPPGGSHGVEVSVSWGYERHDVNVSARKWKRIRSGEAVKVKSIGWYEGKSFECRWYFDLNAEHTLVVSYGNDGADGYIGKISSADIKPRNGRG